MVSEPESRIVQRGRQLYELIEGESPLIFRKNF